MQFQWKYFLICLTFVLATALEKSSRPQRRIAYIDAFPGYIPLRFNPPSQRRAPQVGLYSRRPSSMQGWLSNPKKSQKIANVHAKVQPEKAGQCAERWYFGVRCGVPMDQCKNDKGCPGVTKCCSVADCGFMCVEPSKRKTSKKELKVKLEPKTESVTNSNGLKMEDIMLPSEKSAV